MHKISQGNCRTVTLAFGLLFGIYLSTSDVLAQQQQNVHYPDVNDDPDQGQQQADPPPIRQPRPPSVLFPNLKAPWADELADFRRKAYDYYGLTFGASYQQALSVCIQHRADCAVQSGLGRMGCYQHYLDAARSRRQ